MADTSEHRRLAAIMFTDMVGYGALTQCNEALALELPLSGVIYSVGGGLGTLLGVGSGIGRHDAIARWGWGGRKWRSIA